MTTIALPTTSTRAADAMERPYEIDAVHHLALVSSDMKRTVDFYTNVLGFKLVKTIDMGGGAQHFFLEYAPGQCVAFFQFARAPEKIEGVTGPGFGRADANGNPINRIGGLSAHGTMHHVAFRVPLEKIEQYQRRLSESGLPVSEVVHHGDHRTDPVSGQVVHEDFALSIYFPDPDGICLEFCAYTRALRDEDVLHEPNTAATLVEQPAATRLTRAY